MSNEIATYSMILSKLSLGKSGTECPTKTQILAINSLIVIDNASTYGANECVKIDDIRKKAETWNYYLTVSPTSMSFGAGGGSKSFTVSSYKRKVLDGVEQSGDTSVSLKSTTISGTGFSLSGTTVSASANESTSSRSGTVTITQNESNKTATISLSQSGDTASSYGEWVITVSANPTSVSSSGGTSTITASAKRTIYWESGDVTEETGNPALSTNLGSLSSSSSPSTLTLGENTSTSSRTATINATYSGKSATCTVTQAAGESPDVWDYVFSVNPYQVSVGSGGGSGTVTITSYETLNGSWYRDVSYSIDSSTLPSWATYSNGRFTISSNSSTSSRSANVYFIQSESGKRDYATISQSGYVPPADNYVFTWEDGSTSDVSASFPWDFSANGTAANIPVVSTKNGSSQSWSVSSKPSWITTSTTSSKVTISASDNSGSARSGTIVLTQSGSNKTLRINVSQAAKPVTYNIIFTYELNGTVKQTLTWDIPTSSTTKTVSIPAPSGGWSSSDNISLSLKPSSPGIGWDGNIQVGRPSQFEATGSLVITNNSSGITFTVIYSIEGIGNVFTFADGSTYKKYYSIKQGDTHTVSNLAPFISTVDGKEAGYVAGSSTTGIDVSIKTDNTVSIVTSANSTGQSRTLYQEYRQWNSGYTGETIRIEVEQAG